MMLKNLFFALFIVISGQLSAQKLFDNGKDFDIFHNYTNWGIQLDALAYFPAQVDAINQFSFQSQYALGYKFGLVYNFNLTNHFGLRIGALAGQVPAINTYFVLDQNDINASKDYQHQNWPSYSPIFNFSFPVLFEYRNFSIDRYILSLNGGIQIERTTGAIITDQYQNYYQTSVSNPGSWDIDLIAKAGWYFQFRRLMLQTSVVYKYRMVDQYTGTFVFKNLQNSAPVSGKYIQKGDYVGLSFDFYFHKRAREVEMGCRANTQSAQVKRRQERARREKEKIRKRQEKIKRKHAKKMRKKAKKKWIFW